MNKTMFVVLPLAALLITGCASTGPASTTTQSGSITAEELAQRAAEIERREAELKAEAERLAREREAQTSGATTAAATDDLFPPNPRPGECYARVIIPAQYKSTTEQVLVREAGEKIDIVPAKYGPAEERVLVKEASTRLEVVPAVYETVTEQLLVKPASKKLVQVPAEYKTVTETVLDKPAHTVWKRGTGIGTGTRVAYGGAGAQITRFGDQKVLATRVEDTGEVMCLVEVPASYKQVTKQVLVTPATTREVEIPAEYKTVKKRVLKTPATTREVKIPAEYKTVKTTTLVEPPREVRTPIPAEYATVTRTEKTSDELIEWRPVLCEVNMTRENVSALQTALSGERCYRCGIDGVMGPCTIQGAQCYAKRKGLPSGDKYITMEVVRSLGLKF